MSIDLQASDVVSATDPIACTRALQEAIDRACTQGGGGRVSVGPGEYIVTTLFLRSGLTLHLQRGCVLKAHPDLSVYPDLPRGHNKDRQPYHLLHADGLEGLTIEGDGVIDGNGMAFWDPPQADAPGGLFWHRSKPQRISPLIELRACRDVVLRDFTIRNSPGWTVHPFNCDRLTIRGITIDNYLYGPNTDGLDINGCRDVFISDCDLTCGDDAIIIKSTDDARSSENIVVTNCIISTNCAALGLGAEVTHAIRNVSFSNCAIRQALRIIQIEMWEAGLIENITFSNISGQTLTEVPLERPIYLDIQQHHRTDPALGTLRNVTISNFVATTRGRIMFTAKDGAVIEDVTLRDVQLRYPQIEDASVTVPASRSTQMSNDSPHSRAVNSVVVADNVHRLNLHNVSAAWPEDAGVGYHGVWCRNVKGGVIDCPHLRASRTDVDTLVQNDSELDVRAIG